MDEQSPDFGDLTFFCDNFFVLDTNSPFAVSALSVTYDGQRYAVPADRKQSGNTMHILSIVKQLLAVNTSAISLPQTVVRGHQPLMLSFCPGPRAPRAQRCPGGSRHFRG
jgi:hypothetical protein